MTVTLTLNEITVEQASAVLGLIKARNTAPSAPAETGEPLFDDAPAAAEDLMAETADEPAYTIEQVRAAFTKYAKQNGKEAAKKLLEKFGAGKVTEIKAGDYAAVMKAVG